ncbi:MAG: BamA/TamA family outer membrane protein [Candidatus Omnitrophica bacterium]|nr:BamA/TamA family outer membrane protein [Candidatus Omnitrophota bacterium]
MKKLPKILIISFFIFLNLSLRIYAQPPVIPSTKTGAVEQQFEERAPIYQPTEEEPTFFKLEKPEEEFIFPEDLKVFIKRIDISGNTVLSTKQIKKITSQYENKELNFKALKEMAKAVEKRYRKQGYFLASVYLPQQEIKDGVLKIVILEGRLGKVLVKEARFYNQEFIRKNFHPAKSGVIHYARFVKSLMLLNENSKCEVRATLVKGKERGTTDVILTVKDKLPLNLGYSFNNFGSRYISKRRNDFNINYTNLIAAGDTLSLRTVFGDPFNRLKFARGEYSLFINSYGTRLKFSYDWLEFDAIRELAILDTSGKSKIYGVDLIHPLIRNRNTNLDVGIGFDYKQVYDYLLGEVNSDDELRVLKFKFKFDHLDNFAGRSYLLGMASFGIKDIMGALRDDDVWASRRGAGGEFSKLNLALVRVQKMPFSSYLIIKAAGQYASDDLCIPEQFSIGGADSVRGYPPSEYLGDEGYETSLELRIPPPFAGNIKIPFLKRRIKDMVQIIGFIDHAGVYYKHYLFGERRSNRLTGAGVGLRLNLAADITARIDCGFPIGSTEPSDGANAHIYFEISKKFF